MGWQQVNPADKYIPIEDLNWAENFPPISKIVSRGNKVRVNDCLLEVISTNDAKGTVAFRLAGVFPANLMDQEVAGNS